MQTAERLSTRISRAHGRRACAFAEAQSSDRGTGMAAVVDRLWFGFLLEGEWILRLVFALVLGVLGLERERKDLPAGLRTFMLSLGSCLFTILSLVAFLALRPPESRPRSWWASALSAPAPSSRPTAKRTGRGLTTAADVVHRAIGMAVGAGYYWRLSPPPSSS